jgi:hypothetical protein
MYDKNEFTNYFLTGRYTCFVYINYDYVKWPWPLNYSYKLIVLWKIIENKLN